VLELTLLFYVVRVDEVHSDIYFILLEESAGQRRASRIERLSCDFSTFAPMASILSIYSPF